MVDKLPGCYEVVKMPEHAPAPDRIAFRAVTDVNPSIEEMRFSVDVVNDISKLRRLASLVLNDYRFSDDFRGLYDQFITAAQGGLEYKVGDLRVGRPALENARNDAVVTLGRKARNYFLGRMLVFLCLELVASIALIYFAGQISSALEPTLLPYLPKDGKLDPYIVSVGLAGVGLFLAMILANGWYLRNFTWDKVDYLDRDGLPASLRIILVCVLTLVLMALLAAKAIVVGLMSVELNDFPQHVWLSLLIGFLCGGGEVAISSTVQRAISRPIVTPDPGGAQTPAA